MSRATYVILHLSAPLISFGTVRVDRFSPTSRTPHISMLTGLFANALGYSLPGDADLLDRLQARISATSIMPAELIHAPPLQDLQTVLFPKSAVRWTTGGAETVRTARRGPDQPPYVRTREYLEDHPVVVAVSLEPECESPGPEEIGRALARPARPLYIGRRCCIPQAPLLAGIEQAPGPLAAALKYRRLCATDDQPLTAVCAGENLPPIPGDAMTGSETSRRSWQRGGLHGGETITHTFSVRERSA